MTTKNAKTMLITGGAGFIGSHLVDAFMSNGAAVHVFDNFASGTRTNIKPWLNNSNLTLIENDLSKASAFKELGQNSYEIIFHLAANPEVRVGSTKPDVHFRQNIVTTKNLLEYIRKTQQSPTLVFFSTSTVYGEPSKIPTPEDHSPLRPISVYGATKLACEAIISAYAHTYGFKAVVYRLANVIGPRGKHGVIYDFIQKLKKNPKELVILGDGTQTKSYLYIDDCVKAMLVGLAKTESNFETYNVGSEDQINIEAIAEIVVEAMNLKGVKFTLTGGVDGGRGWKGDVKNMLLDISKIKLLGWKPTFNSKEAVEKTAEELLRTMQF